MQLPLCTFTNIYSQKLSLYMYMYIFPSLNKQPTKLQSQYCHISYLFLTFHLLLNQSSIIHTKVLVEVNNYFLILFSMQRKQIYPYIYINFKWAICVVVLLVQSPLSSKKHYSATQYMYVIAQFISILNPPTFSANIWPNYWGHSEPMLWGGGGGQRYCIVTHVCWL